MVRGLRLDLWARQAALRAIAGRPTPYRPNRTSHDWRPLIHVLDHRPAVRGQRMSGQPTTECIETTWSRTEDGYGRGWVEGRHVRAHRWAWETVNGAIPTGLHVLHRCDNPPCVNISHLFLGTNADNIQDRSRKHRSVHKLTPAVVGEIKRLLREGVSQRELSRRNGVSLRAIQAIQR